MKFRLKITICMVWLLALAFGIGGSLLFTLNFSGNFQQKKEAALSSYRMVLNTLRIVDELGQTPDHSNLTESLSRLSSQGVQDLSAQRLGSDDVAMFEENPLAIDLTSPVETSADEGSVSVVQDMYGGRHLRISAKLSTAGDVLRFDQCYEIDFIYRQRDEQLRTYRQVFSVIAALAAVLCWGLSYWLTRPLYALSDASKRFASGELSYRAKVSANDELGLLTQDFNSMAEKIEENIQAITDAAARQESFMGNFAHELKNPMTSIIGYAELIRSQTLSQDEQMEAANYIFSEGKRLESLSLKLLDILVLKRKEVELVPARPAQIVGSMVRHLERVYAAQGITLQCKCQEGECLLEPDLVRSLLVNILDNSRKAMDNGGNIYVVSQMIPEGCLIRVLDTGRGIPQEELAHITEAFYRVDKSRSRAQGGVGLGLALCSEIVSMHKGSMLFESRIGNGTCVTIELKGGAV